MIKVTVSIDIKHPKDKTFAFIANPENNPRWQQGMQKCTITTPGKLGIGSQYQQEAKFLGKPVITTFEITEFEENHLIKGESLVSTFPITFKRIVEGDHTISHVRAIVTGDPGGLLGVFPFITRWMIKSSISRDYQRLKKMLENDDQ